MAENCRCLLSWSPRKGRNTMYEKGHRYIQHSSFLGLLKTIYNIFKSIIFKSGHWLKKKSPKAWVLTDWWTSAIKQCVVLRPGLIRALFYFSSATTVTLHVNLPKVSNIWNFASSVNESCGQWAKIATSEQQTEACTTRRIFAPW